MFPEETKERIELIGGELVVTPQPTQRHQAVVGEVFARLWLYAQQHGGKAYVSPTGVYLREDDFLLPDVFFIRQEHLGRIGPKVIRGAPDLVVEVSSPRTRRDDLTRRRDRYERHGVSEYWFVDLDDEAVRIFRSTGGRYGEPEILGRGSILTSAVLPGLEIEVDAILGPRPE